MKLINTMKMMGGGREPHSYAILTSPNARQFCKVGEC